MSLMEKYENQVKDFEEKLAKGKMPLNEMAIYQELKYRLYVISSLKAFSMLAPVTDKKEMIGAHYGLTTAFLKLLVGEHPLGPTADEATMQKRETAEESLQNVVMDGIRRFKKFAPSSNKDYQEAICKHINALIPVWIQCRNTYICL